MPTRLIVETAGERLDRYLSGQFTEHSRTQIQRWIADGNVLVNGRTAKASTRVRDSDVISIDRPPILPATIEPEDIPLEILYEDEDLIAVNKPAGLVVHPAPGHERGTLVNAILFHCPGLEGVGGVQRPGIVHRLDKDTSGVILVAKNDRSHRFLQTQFKDRTVHKSYIALAIGQIEPERGRIDAAIGRHPKHRKRMAVVPANKGRAAITDYGIISFYGNYTLVEVHPETGRTHQIRVHFASLGHPLVGDTVYGPKRDPFHLMRHFLHAQRIRFLRPQDDTELDLNAPLSVELKVLLEQLG